MTTDEANTFTGEASTSTLLADQQLSEAGLSLLGRLSSIDYPLGARLAREHLVEQGFTISEASVSRLLLDLDKAGWTSRAGTKGRVATEAGRSVAASVSAARRREREYSRALDITTIDQVLDLLRARRAVESEAARAAAMHATDQDLRYLGKILGKHRGALQAGVEGRSHGLQFHRRVVEMSRNALLVTMSGVLLSEQLEYLEQVIDVIMTASGSLGESAVDHGEILVAFEKRDPEAAEKIMRSHLDRLIGEVEAFAEGSSNSAFLALLDLAQR